LSKKNGYNGGIQLTFWENVIV